MKVLFVSHLQNLTGGAEQSLLDLLKVLNTKKSLDLHVIVPKQGKLSRELSKLHIAYKVVPFGLSVFTENKEKSNSNVQSNILNFPKIVKALREINPDIVVTNTSTIPWFAYLTKQLGIPHIWYLHELVGKNNISYYPDAKTILETVSSYAENIVVNSQFTKEFYQSNLSVTNMTIVRPLIDKKVISQYLPLINNGERDTDTTKIICFSSILPKKNQYELLQAIDKLRLLSDQPFHLTLLGTIADKDYYNKLQYYIRSHKLGNLVTFTGFSDNPYSIVKEHDICITPSIEEPYGRVTVEAMALGKVVIASDSGGNKEIINGSNCAYLYRTGDYDQLAKTLSKLLGDWETIDRIGKKAHDYGKNVVINNDVDVFYNLLQNIYSQSKISKPISNNWLFSEQLNITEEVKRLTSDNHYFIYEGRLMQRKIIELENKVDNLNKQNETLQKTPIVKIISTRMKQRITRKNPTL